jgi:hypothetical protein
MGAQASVAAGPVGRSATAQTDARLSADILSWSRSKGLFAGIALTGAALRNDLDENRELYGRSVHHRDILLTNMRPPAAARDLTTALNAYSRESRTTNRSRAGHPPRSPERPTGPALERNRTAPSVGIPTRRLHASEFDFSASPRPTAGGQCGSVPSIQRPPHSASNRLSFMPVLPARRADLS